MPLPSQGGDIRCDHACAPYDRLTLEMDQKWGIGQLPSLVSTATAEKFGRVIARLNAAINADEPATVAVEAATAMRGLVAMDAEAAASGRTPFCVDVWEYDLDGHHFGIVRDVTSWKTAEAMHPTLRIYTMREVANALAAYGQTVAAVKDAFPGAEVVAVRDRSPIESDLNDFIPF